MHRRATFAAVNGGFNLLVEDKRQWPLKCTTSDRLRSDGGRARKGGSLLDETALRPRDGRSCEAAWELARTHDERRHDRVHGGRSLGAP